MNHKIQLSSQCLYADALEKRTNVSIACYAELVTFSVLLLSLFLWRFIGNNVTGEEEKEQEGRVTTEAI